jgi:hypothetical protein
MYTYRLAAEVWHHLLQIVRSPVRNPPSGSSTVKVPGVVDRLDGDCVSQPQCASLLASLVCSVTQTVP